jgi:hypothetical protein
LDKILEFFTTYGYDSHDALLQRMEIDKNRTENLEIMYKFIFYFLEIMYRFIFYFFRNKKIKYKPVHYF